MPDSEKLNAFKGLLKAYQTEIDNLTKRSKSAENAFLSAYKVLAEAPDPYPLLEAAVDQAVKIAEVQEKEAAMQRLQEENTELRKRVGDLSASDNARRRAEVKAEQLEQKMEDLIQERVAQKENELNATYDEKLRNYEEREHDLQRQLELTRDQLRDLRSSNESNQAKLLDHSQRQDQEVIAKLAELDIIVADLDRANSRVAAVERRNEILRAEIETLKSGSEGSERYAEFQDVDTFINFSSVKALQAQIEELETETDRLSCALDTLKRNTAEEAEGHSKHIDELQKEIRNKSRETEQMKLKLKQYSDYDEIKRELEIMKYVEFAGLEDDTPDQALADGADVYLPSPNADVTNSHRGKSLEVLLATKNKRILEELTKFRILHSELEQSLQSSSEQLEAVTRDLEKQRVLNEKLENDLLAMNQHKDSHQRLESSDILAGLDMPKKSQDSTTRSTPIPFASSADTSILPIVTSQRDRFRQRNAELEDELRKQYQIISELRTEIKTLQADNLKLYEKVRYMQSYREEAGARPPVSQLDPLPNPNGRSDDMSRYHARYEEAMNPFEAFRGREATRAYKSLNPFERGVLVLTRAILGNRRARTFFILYALALHILVMFTTYECTTSSSSQLQKQPSPYGP
ncbi:hypothetical protein AX16_010662 [Volvariella volvacea WC 439]|nr:hypothetical protein AX16_010662 [Volvariella volvacea WC 439]